MVACLFDSSLFPTAASAFKDIGILVVDDGLSFLCALKYFSASSLVSKLFHAASG